MTDSFLIAPPGKSCDKAAVQRMAAIWAVLSIATITGM
jgi:hypothetical protein